MLRTLRGRLVLLLCFATAPALLVIFLVASQERAAVSARLELEARHLAEFASREHAHQLQGARDLLLRLRGRVGCGANGPRLRTPGLLPELLAGSPQFANIGIVASDGKVRYAGYGGDSGANLASQPPFARTRTSRQIEVGTYTIGPIVRRPVLYLADGIRDGDGRPCGAAFVAADLRWLDRLARQESLPPGYALLIADRQGQVLAESASLATAGGHPSIPGLVALLRATPTRVVLPAGDPPGKRVFGAVPTRVVLPAGDPPEKRVFVAAPMEGVSGVFAVASLPFGRVLREANRAFFGTLLGFGLLVVFTIAAGIVAAEISVLRVLRALSRAVRAFGGGDLSVRATLPTSHDELRDLAGAFNTMADALAERHRDATAAQGQLRALSHRLQAAREEEAGRIARELHDELGQVLTSVRIDLASLARSLGPAAHGRGASATDDRSPGRPAPPESGAAPPAHALPASVQPGPGDRPVPAIIPEMIGRIDGAIEFVRQISSELRPTVLDRLGLGAALRWLAGGIETRTGLAVVLDVHDVPDPAPELASITVFRIAQEALTNVVRHAGATHVKIDLVCRDRILDLAVQDDGRGLDQVSEGSLGILGMRERARLAGGTCDIAGPRGVGTTVRASIPLDPPGDEAG